MNLINISFSEWGEGLNRQLPYLEQGQLHRTDFSAGLKAGAS